MEESGNVFAENGGHEMSSHHATQLSAGKKQYRVPKVSPPQPLMSLGKVPKLLNHHNHHPSGKTSYSFDSATDILGGLGNNQRRNGETGGTSPSIDKADRSNASFGCNQPVEKARLQLKSLSLQNGKKIIFFFVILYAGIIMQFTIQLFIINGHKDENVVHGRIANLIGKTLKKNIYKRVVVLREKIM